MDTSNKFYQVVSEADVDWIICMELNSSPEFRDFLAQQIFGQAVEHVEALRSIADPVLGESDLLWLVKTGDGRILMALIENKINAGAQPEQCERYFKRAEKYVEERRCEKAITTLICPQSYSSDDSENYEKRISYEELKSHFSSTETERNTYLSSILEAALRKKSYHAEPDGGISNFRMKLWELANKEFQELGLEKPKPGREFWIIKNYGDFQIKYKMLQSKGKFTDCYVDIELAGQAKNIEQLKVQYKSSAETIGAKIVTASKSAAIRIHVPMVCPPDFDEEPIRIALKEWLKLLTWWRAVKN